MKTNQSTILFLLITFFVLISAGCNMPQAEPTPDVALIVAKTQTAIAVEYFLTSTYQSTQGQPSLTPNQESTANPTIINTPAAPTSTLDCTDKAKFVSETIPDGSKFTSGESFIKKWTLQNVGTCTWTTEYSIVFDKGEQMGGSSPSPIGTNVPPNEYLEITLPQTAPQEAGEYQGFWKLRNQQGNTFGLGQEADVSFWAKIIVGKDGNINTKELGTPSWVETFSSSRSAFNLGKDSDIGFEIQDGKLVMTAYTSSGDQWRVASSVISDFYIQSVFKTTENCSGKDSYGMLVRAPRQPDSIIDSGYVLSFSCDGHYRVYRIDNGSYNSIINWTFHPNILNGPNQTNTMGIQSEGNSLQLYANDIMVYEFNDDTYGSGLFGLSIRSERTPNLQIIVKEVAYWIQ